MSSDSDYKASPKTRVLTRHQASRTSSERRSPSDIFVSSDTTSGSSDVDDTSPPRNPDPKPNTDVSEDVGTLDEVNSSFNPIDDENSNLDDFRRSTYKTYRRDSDARSSDGSGLFDLNLPLKHAENSSDEGLFDLSSIPGLSTGMKMVAKSFGEHENR